MKKSLFALLLMSSPLLAQEFPSFMAGHWRSTIDGVTMEEQWLPPSGNLMLGVHRDVRADGKTAFEFLRIEVRNGKPAYVAMPGGRPATIFPLASLTGSRVVFENPDHDFPQRIIYWLENESLCARVEGEMNGKNEAEQWCWQRVED